MFKQTKSTALASLVALGSLAASIQPALAGSPERAVVQTQVDGTRYQVVRFDDLDLSSAAGNKTLHARLNAAARRVCADAANPQPLPRVSAAQCRGNAVARAIAAIGGIHHAVRISDSREARG